MKKQRKNRYSHAEEVNKLENLEKRYEEHKIGKKKELKKLITHHVVFITAFVVILVVVDILIISLITIPRKEDAKVNIGIVEGMEIEKIHVFMSRSISHKYVCKITLNNGFKARMEFDKPQNYTACEKQFVEFKETYLGKNVEIWYTKELFFWQLPYVAEINGGRTRWDSYRKNAIEGRIIMPILADTILILTSVFIYNWAPFSPIFHFYEYSYHKNSLKIIEERISRKTKK